MDTLLTMKKGRTGTQLLLGCIAILAITFLFMHTSYAQGTAPPATDASGLWQNAQYKAQDFFYQFRTVVLIICGIAIIATLVTAVSGRFPIQKAVVITIAIMGIALASSIVTYFASNTSQPQANTYVPTESDTAGTQG